MAMTSGLRQYQVNPVGVWHGRCNAPGCPRETDTLTWRGSGIFHESLYCRHHSCLFRTADGTPCPQPKGEDGAFCDKHMRCAARPGGVPCREKVRDGKPNIYRYCMQLHNCTVEGCPNQRTSRNHLHCAEHHGEHHGEHHDCGRERHARDEGIMAPFCAAHYRCAAPGCDQLRARGRHCQAHTCDDDGCAEGLAPGSNYCRRHACQEDDCPEKRLASFCRRHECCEAGCEARAARAGRCLAHAEANRAFLDALGTLGTPPLQGPSSTTAAPGGALACQYRDLDALCVRAARPDARYCARHSCAARRCPRAQLHFSPYCEAHKCAVVECAEPPWADGHGHGHARRRFCERHACRHADGCADQAREGATVCLPHRRCRWMACGRAVGDEGVDGLCARHREVARTPFPAPAGTAGGPSHGWGMPGQYPGYPGYPGQCERPDWYACQ